MVEPIYNPYERLKDETMANALRVGVLSALAGAGTRGIPGLVHFLQRQTGPNRIKSVKRKTTVALPMDVKMASDSKTPAISFESLAKDINKTLSISAPNGPRDGMVGFAMGDQAATANDIPWRIPVTLGALTAGGLGGWHLMDTALDATRRAEKESEVAEAERRYMEALQGASKRAGAEDPLDKLYNQLEKQGGLGTLAGLYLATALGTGALSGYTTYNYTRENSKDKLLEKARKLRQAQLMQRGALPVAIKIQPNA